MFGTFLPHVSPDVLILHSTMQAALSGLPENSLDSCVTDPPYHLASMAKRYGKSGVEDSNTRRAANSAPIDGIARLARGFMGKAWDDDVAARAETWSHVYRVLKPGAWLFAFGGDRTVHRMTTAIEDSGFEIRRLFAWIYGQGMVADPHGVIIKPALEPIVLARKPLIGSVAENVAVWGTGALRIDDCRIGTAGGTKKIDFDRGKSVNTFGDGLNGGKVSYPQGLGRYPSNVITDGSTDLPPFFYVAKASKADRNGSRHPTIKPITLIEYLQRLITPVGGTTPDCFAGSGTSIAAARRNGLRIIAIEREPQYYLDCVERTASRD